MVVKKSWTFSVGYVEGVQKKMIQVKGREILEILEESLRKRNEEKKQEKSKK